MATEFGAMSPSSSTEDPSAAAAIRQEVSSIDTHLESLIGEIPKLTSGCTEFIESADKILEKRKLKQTLLANHSTLLEIPQLMDTLFRTLYEATTQLEFLSLCRAFVEVAFPHSATCFGPGVAMLVMDAKNTYDGLSRLLSVSPTREEPSQKPANPVSEAKNVSENGEASSSENGVSPEAGEHQVETP